MGGRKTCWYVPVVPLHSQIGRGVDRDSSVEAADESIQAAYDRMAQLENDTLAAARARLDKMNQEKAAALAQMAQVGKEMNEQVRSIRLLAADD